MTLDLLLQAPADTRRLDVERGRRAWCALAVLSAALLVGPPVAAQTPKPPPKPAAKAAPQPVLGKPIEPVMTREQLRACMTQQEKVREQNAEAARLQTELEREKADLLKDGEELKAELANLDRTDAALVEAYNKRATARDERITAFEPRVNAFNAKAEALNAERAAYKRDCDNKKYDEKDEKALKKQSP